MSQSSKSGVSGLSRADSRPKSAANRQVSFKSSSTSRYGLSKHNTNRCANPAIELKMDDEDDVVDSPRIISKTAVDVPSKVMLPKVSQWPSDN